MRLTRYISFAPRSCNSLRCSGFGALAHASTTFRPPCEPSQSLRFALLGGRNVRCSHRYVQFFLGLGYKVFPRHPWRGKEVDFYYRIDVMESDYNVITLFLGIVLFLIGLVISLKRIARIKRNKIIIGEIYDRRSGYKDHYFPVIKYEIENEIEEYQSSHYSILQKIGRKIRLVYNEKEKYVIGTIGELFFIPINITFIGLFIIVVMILYLCSV